MTTPFAPEQCVPNTVSSITSVGREPRIRRPDGTGNSGALPFRARALAVRQPWAWLIIHAGKDIENRIWHTHFRGPVLIHASTWSTRSRRYEEWCAAREWVSNHVGEAVAAKIPNAHDLQYGGIIGQVEIIGCADALSAEATDSPWFEGPWGFVLRAPKPLPFAPCRGSLGFFTPVFVEVT